MPLIKFIVLLKMNESKKDIVIRVYLVAGGLLLFCFALIFQLVKVQYLQGAYWKSKSKELTTQYQVIEASRGNIYADDGSLLATSLPIYELRMDMIADGINSKLFNQNLDSLAWNLSNLFGDKSKDKYKRELKAARKKKDRYHLIQRGVRYTQLKKVKQFPIFKLGKYKGGLICLQDNKREQPFKNLAVRTIGYNRENGKSVGLEATFNEDLKGKQGKRLMQKIAGGIWMPINSENEIEPQNGADMFTTLDVNIQDVAQHALINQLIKNKADHGCAVVMEVKTGKIKAMANFTRKDSNTYIEQYNYAIAEGIDPGSTFKLVSYLVAIDDGFISINDTVDCEGGRKAFGPFIIKDSHEGYGRMSVKSAFEKSSNVAVSKIIQKYYGKNPRKFTDKLYKIGINNPTGIEIAGESKPIIKNPKSKSWSSTSLPFMAHGYELGMSPIQTLCIYNAVANDGIYVKPMLVNKIERNGTLIKKYSTQVNNKSIASKKTIDQLQSMLEGVVEQGTATNLKTSYLKIAGKTGTAQIARGNKGYGNQENDEFEKMYQASFCGYFPADKPIYSCIVVINNPRTREYTGNTVAGPIFKEIADKIYATHLQAQLISINDSIKNKKIDITKLGYQYDFAIIFKNMSNAIMKTQKSDWVSVQSNKIENLAINTKNKVPQIMGMGLRDAMYLLENKGFQVKVIGKGTVKRITQNTTNSKLITIELS